MVSTKLLLIILTVIVFDTLGLGLIEPDIQCTVTKVIKAQDVLGLKNFPKKYDAIVNNGMLSKLSIRSKPFKSEAPSTIFKEGLREKILIKKDGAELIIDVKGKPMSRQGTLKINNELVAEVTCH